jgi:hypothetical protein
VPRVMNEYSPLTKHKSHTLVYHHDGHAEYAQRQTPGCTGTLSLPCFNLTRCSPFEPIKVYPYGVKIGAMLDKAMKKSKGAHAIQKTDNPDDACLLVVGEGSFDTPQQLLENKHWQGGQNHYIFDSSRLFGNHGDRPFNTECHFGLAATSQLSMDDAYNREGYDTPLGLYPKWKRPAKYDNLDIDRKRRLLVSFRGAIYSWETIFWQHRWIAAEYWESTPDVHVDTECAMQWKYDDPKQKALHNPNRKEYDDEDPLAFEELLMNSTFVFCPGGMSIECSSCETIHQPHFPFSLSNRWMSQLLQVSGGFGSRCHSCSNIQLFATFSS